MGYSLRLTKNPRSMMSVEVLFDYPIIGRLFKTVCMKIEGGDKTSASLRKYAKTMNVDVGMYTYGSCFKKEFNVGGSVKIGRYCSFGPNIRYFGANHPVEMAVMSPYFYNKSWGGFEVTDVPRSCLSVGNDVWIGANVIITSGCHEIGNGAVIGAGTVVTKDVDPYDIFVGNPGHTIKKRFDNDCIAALEQSQWWDLTPNELYSMYDKMSDPILFSKAVCQLKKNRK